MTLLHDNARRILDAMDEAKAGLLIDLYDNKIIPNSGKPELRRKELFELFIHPNVFVSNEENANYWLDEFAV